MPNCIKAVRWAGRGRGSKPQNLQIGDPCQDKLQSHVPCGLAPDREDPAEGLPLLPIRFSTPCLSLWPAAKLAQSPGFSASEICRMPSTMLPHFWQRRRHADISQMRAGETHVLTPSASADEAVQGSRGRVGSTPIGPDDAAPRRDRGLPALPAWHLSRG